MILDGVWPPQVIATEARHANAASALQALFRRCEADPECAQRYPDLEQESLAGGRPHYEEHPTTAEYFDYYLSEPFKEEVDGHFTLRKGLQSLQRPFVDSVSCRSCCTEIRRRRPSMSPEAFYRYRHIVQASIDDSAAWASLLCHAEGRFADRRGGPRGSRRVHPRMVDPDAPDLVPVALRGMA